MNRNALTRVLLLTLAFMLSLALFGCGGDEGGSSSSGGIQHHPAFDGSSAK